MGEPPTCDQCGRALDPGEPSQRLHTSTYGEVIGVLEGEGYRKEWRRHKGNGWYTPASAAGHFTSTCPVGPPTSLAPSAAGRSTTTTACATAGGPAAPRRAAGSCPAGSGRSGSGANRRPRTPSSPAGSAARSSPRNARTPASAPRPAARKPTGSALRLEGKYRQRLSPPSRNALGAARQAASCWFGTNIGADIGSGLPPADERVKVPKGPRHANHLTGPAAPPGPPAAAARRAAG
jgi:hypothetical protein